MTTICRLLSAVARSRRVFDGVDTAHRAVIGTAKRDLRDRPERAMNFLWGLGLRPEPAESGAGFPRRRSPSFRWRYSLVALDRVLAAGGWRHVPAPGKLPWVARAVFNETLRVKRTRAREERRWISDPVELGRVRRHFVEAVGGRECLLAFAAERGLDAAALFTARTLSRFRDVARRINGLRGLPGDADLLDGFRVVPQSAQPRVTDGGAWVDDPSEDPNGERPEGGRSVFRFNGELLTWRQVEACRPEEPAAGLPTVSELPAVEGVRFRREPQDERVRRLLAAKLPPDETEVLRLVYEDGEDPVWAARAVGERTGADPRVLIQRLRVAGQRADTSRHPVATMKAEFKRRRLSDAAIAALLGVSRKSVNAWLCERRPLPAGRYAALVALVEDGGADGVTLATPQLHPRLSRKAQGGANDRRRDRSFFGPASITNVEGEL